MRNLVYLETSFFSFYYDNREKSGYRKLVTQDWWDTQKQFYNVYTSAFTNQELDHSEYPNSEKIFALAKEVPILEANEDIAGIIQVYIQNKIMPEDDSGDAAHLAIASYHSVDFLLTWNCKHIANANKYEHIQKINRRLGLLTPLLLTPEMLFKEESNG